MNKPFYKTKGFFVVYIVICLFAAGLYLNDQIKSKSTLSKNVIGTEQDQEKSESTVKKSPEEIKSEIIGTINAEIKILKTEEIFKKEYSTLEEFGSAVRLIETWCENVTSIKDNGDKDILKVKNELSKIVSNMFVKSLPMLRKNYVKLIGDSMWENNIKVTSAGSSYKTLTFIGNIFTDNKNKSDFQKLQSDFLHKLRFERVNYKWFESEEGYTYYKIDSPKDSDIQ